MIQIIFLPVSKLFVTFIRQTWKWDAIFRTYRNQTFSFQSVFPLHNKSMDCVYTQDSNTTSNTFSDARAAVSPPSGYAYTGSIRAQELLSRSPHGQNHSPAYCLPNPSRNVSTSDLLWASHTHHGIVYVLPYRSLEQKQRTILERTCKLPATSTHDWKASPESLIG